ncbi:hypothetical protein ABGB17_29115 [Sphaerisporangium sp. B11E5]|uniref:hypothetical protein n=1 Tax=Sphaerisporangium sp. B11E5 TaxID=3153563 RepID=UPI00325F8A5E
MRRRTGDEVKEQAAVTGDAPEVDLDATADPIGPPDEDATQVIPLPVVVAARSTPAPPTTEPEAKPERQPAPEPEPEAKSQSKPKPEPEAGPERAAKSKPEPEAEPERAANSKLVPADRGPAAKSKPEPADPKPAARSKPEPDAAPEHAATSEPEPEREADPGPKAGSAPRSEPGGDPESDPDREPEPEPDPALVPVPGPEPGEESDPDREPEAEPGSDPDLEPEDATVEVRKPAVPVVRPAGPEPGREPDPEPEPLVPLRIGRAPATDVRPSWATRVAGSAATWLPPLLTVEGLVMYVLALRVPYGPMRGVDLRQLDGLGLVSVLPVTAFAAIALIIVSFFVTLTQNTDRKGLLLFQLAAVTFTLHGAAALVEPEPRFATAWVHAGFAEYIGRAGETLPGLDARFAWPGFFALFGFVLRAAGVDDMTTILQWTPFVSNLLYLLPFVLILRRLVATTRARWFAALLFILVQWIGQDYFSPQGFTYALYLVFIAILLRWFGKAEPRSAPLPSKGPLRRLLARLDRLAPGELPSRPTTVTDRVVLLTLLVGLFVATTATHQITPFMMLGALTGLILLRRSTLSLTLPVFLGLLVLAWINYQATPFWSGRIDELFGGIGRIFANLQENTGDRLQGTDPQHALVLQVRLGICGVILLFAGVGLLRRLRRGVGDRVAVLLLCVPALALGLQSYGGEIGLRVYLFALPAACILGSYAFFPNLPAHTGTAREEETVPVRRRRVWLPPETTRRLSAVLAACTALALSVAFLVARYGNEKFEWITTGEAAAMRYVYEHDQPSARLLYLVPVLGDEVTPTVPWRERDIDRVDYFQALVTPDPGDLEGVLTALRAQPPNTFVIMSRGQAAYLELNHGFSGDWGTRFRASLDDSRYLRKVYANADAALYTLRSYPRGAEIPPPSGMTLVGDRSTPWTPFGLVALALAVGTLFSAELARLRGPGTSTRGRRRLVLIGLLMTAAALAVIVERFLTLTSV